MVVLPAQTRRVQLLKPTTWLTSVLMIVAIAGAAVSEVRGADALSVDILPIVPRSRSSAPVQVFVTFDVESRSLLKGELELVVYDSPDLRAKMYTCRTGPMSLVRGKHTRRLTLPTMAMQYAEDSLGAEAYWIDAANGDRLLLGRYTIPAVSYGQRGGIVCVSDPWRGSLARYSDIVRALRLERYLPDKNEMRPVSTFPARLGPESMPKRPLGYCTFDIVALIGEGLEVLDRSHLEAILAWIEAGGSVFVTPSANPQSAQRRFLEALRTGRKTDPVQTQADVEYYRVGLGRAVIDMRPIDRITTSLETPEWRDAAAFLWKLTDQQRRHVAANGTWRTDLQRFSRERQQFQQYYGEGLNDNTLSYHLLPSPQGSGLVMGLMPHGVRLIPFGTIVLILVLYLLAIGPVDWFGLGLIRQRKFTWLLFPLVTAVVTGSTVMMCNAYMGRQDQRRALSFVNVGTGSRVLCVNRFELLFAGAETVADTDIQNAILTPMDHHIFGSWYGYRGGYMSGLSVGPPRYRGQFPQRFCLTQRLAQWTPQLNRTLRIAPGDIAPDGPMLNWDSVDPSAFETEQGRRQVVKQLVGDAPFNGDIILMNQYTQYGLHKAKWRPGVGSSGGHHGDLFFAQAGNRWHKDPTDRISSAVELMLHGRPEFPIAFLLQACCRASEGLFSIVSQISPTGGANFEDLTILDPTDPNQWLLVVIVPDGEDYIVYRRLYFGDG